MGLYLSAIHIPYIYTLQVTQCEKLRLRNPTTGHVNARNLLNVEIAPVAKITSNVCQFKCIALKPRPRRLSVRLLATSVVLCYISSLTYLRFSLTQW